MTATKCTTRMLDRPGYICGAPAVYVEGEFAECAECIKHPASMYATRRVVGKADEFGVKVGDVIPVERHGEVYDGRVVHVTRTGKVDATVVYDNGATRTIRVKAYGKVWA